jgi:hypothetical protein
LLPSLSQRFCIAPTRSEVAPESVSSHQGACPLSLESWRAGRTGSLKPKKSKLTASELSSWHSRKSVASRAAWVTTIYGKTSRWDECDWPRSSEVTAKHRNLKLGHAS